MEFRAKVAGAASPVGALTRRSLAGFSRLGAARGRGQAAGLQWDDADRIARQATGDGLTGMRDAAVIAVTSDALLRVSEVAAIEVAHIRPAKAGGATLWVPRSKTDQGGEGATQFIGATTSAYVAKWRAAGGVNDGHLFRGIYRDQIQPKGIGTKTVTRIIQRRARECGMADGVSGHSLRIGSAQSLAGAGASLVEMQQEGRWKSARMPAHYASGEIAERRATARLRYGGKG